MQILPAIIEDTFADVKRKIELVAPYVSLVQIDVADGAFVPRVTWTKIEDLAAVPVGLSIDLHIMVKDPLAFIVRTRGIESIKRITFHYEATKDCTRVIKVIQDAGQKAGMAINPETSIDELRKPPLGPLLTKEGVAERWVSGGHPGQGRSPYIDAILIMGVNPGWGGQGFLPMTPSRIAAMKTAARGTHMKVGVDGGIHLASGSAQACVNAGADFLVVGSDIFSTSDPSFVIRKLQKLQPSSLPQQGHKITESQNH